MRSQTSAFANDARGRGTDGCTRLGCWAGRCAPVVQSYCRDTEDLETRQGGQQPKAKVSVFPALFFVCLLVCRSFRFTTTRAPQCDGSWQAHCCLPCATPLHKFLATCHLYLVQSFRCCASPAATLSEQRRTSERGREGGGSAAATLESDTSSPWTGFPILLSLHPNAVCPFPICTFFFALLLRSGGCVNAQAKMERGSEIEKE